MTRRHATTRPMRYSIFTLLSIASISSFCFAVNANATPYKETQSYKGMSFETKTSWWNPIVTVSGGAAFASNLNTSTYIPSRDPSEDNYFRYHASNGNQTAPVFGLFVATEIPINDSWRVQAGISYNQPFAFNARGTVTQGPVMTNGQPEPNASSQFNYRYNMSAHQILAQAKLLYNWRDKYYPYLMLGLGTSYNESSHFDVGISPPNTTLSNHFQGNNQFAFSYAAGLGLDVDVAQHWRVGIGYRFTNYGQSKTGNSIIDKGGVNNDGLVNPQVGSHNDLSLSHLYSNEVSAQFTYLIG